MRLHTGNTDAILQDCLGDISADVNLVMIESCGTQGYSLNHGLTLSLGLAEDNQDVLMLGWQSAAAYASDPRWHACMAHRSIDFSLLPLGIDEIKALLLTTPCNRRPADPLALRLLDVSSELTLIKTLKHDLSGFECRPVETQQRFETEAKKLFGDLPLEELIAKVEETHDETPVNTFVGESFPDIFVDIEGTLIQDGEINRSLLEQLNEVSANRPVTIWTGGDIKQYEPQIRQSGIAFKIASKYLFKGAQVSTAFDDLSQDEFTLRYGVEVTDYLRV